MKVIGRKAIPEPYTYPTVAWEVEIKGERFVVPMGPGYASGPGDEDHVLRLLREYAEDEWSDVDELTALFDGGRDSAETLMAFGAEIGRKLEKIGELEGEAE